MKPPQSVLSVVRCAISPTKPAVPVVAVGAGEMLAINCVQFQVGRRRAAVVMASAERMVHAGAFTATLDLTAARAAPPLMDVPVAVVGSARAVSADVSAGSSVSTAVAYAQGVQATLAVATAPAMELQVSVPVSMATSARGAISSALEGQACPVWVEEHAPALAAAVRQPQHLATLKELNASVVPRGLRALLAKTTALPTAVLSSTTFVFAYQGTPAPAANWFALVTVTASYAAITVPVSPMTQMRSVSANLVTTAFRAAHHARSPCVLKLTGCTGRPVPRKVSVFAK